MAREALERFCDEWFAAWTGGDAARLASYYTDDAFYADPARPQGLRGREALQRYFGRLLPANPDMVWRRETLHPIEDGFVVTWRATIPLPGGPLVERGCDIVLLRDGRIAHNEVYFDLARWNAALGRA